MNNNNTFLSLLSYLASLLFVVYLGYISFVFVDVFMYRITVVFLLAIFLSNILAKLYVKII